MKALHIFLAATLILALAGPATVSAEQTVTENRKIIETTQSAPGESVVTQTHTRTIETQEGPDVDIDVGGGGIISTTLDVAGDVLALPFKLIGGLIRLAF